MDNSLARYGIVKDGAESCLCDGKDVRSGLYIFDATQDTLSVIVTMVPQKYILEKEHDYRIQVYPGGDACCTLYEDDGFTYDHHHENNSGPKIDGMQPVRDMTVVLHLPKVRSVLLNGEAVPTHKIDGCAEVLLPAASHEAGDVRVRITIMKRHSFRKEAVAQCYFPGPYHCRYSEASHFRCIHLHTLRCQTAFGKRLAPCSSWIAPPLKMAENARKLTPVSNRGFHLWTLRLLLKPYRYCLSPGMSQTAGSQN